MPPTVQGHGLGYLADEPDERDRLFAARLQSVGFDADELPESVDHRLHLPAGATLHQGPLGSCVWNALSYALTQQRFVQGFAYDPLSRLFGYWHSRNQHGATDFDSGTYIRTSVKILNRLGRVSERIYPYVVDDLGRDRPRFTRKPPPYVLMGAHDKKLVTYERIYGSGDERRDQIRAAVASARSVVFGTDVSRDFVNYQERSDRMQIWPTPTSSVGGHAMAIVGYDPQSVTIAQSWGKGWGQDGFARLSWDWILASMTRDIWSIWL